MIHRIAKFIDRFSPVGVADAHCDIPCGIYDPRDAIQAAQTVIRMTELIGEASGGDMTMAAGNSFQPLCRGQRGTRRKSQARHPRNLDRLLQARTLGRLSRPA